MDMLPPLELGTPHLGTLSNELRGIKLSNHSFQDLITDRGKDPFIIIKSQSLIHGGQLVLVRSVEDSETNVDHLQVLATSWGGHQLWACTDVINNGVMQPRDPTATEHCS